MPVERWHKMTKKEIFFTFLRGYDSRLNTHIRPDQSGGRIR
jgi:hypothetical protein